MVASCACCPAPGAAPASVASSRAGPVVSARCAGGFYGIRGHLLGLEVSVEESPQRLVLPATESEALNHAYGTTGIITLRLSTAAAVDWRQLAVDCEHWSDAKSLCCSPVVAQLLICICLERSVLEHLPAWSGPVDGSAPSASACRSRCCGERASPRRHGCCAGERSRPGRSRSGNSVRELTWNHTTLHVRAAQSGWTYLQMLLPQPEQPALDALKARWGDDLLWHLEAVRQQGALRLAALPLVRWTGLARLEALMQDCRDAGAVLFNPHVLTVEDGGLGVVDGDQVAAKQRFDPGGLLNPGKIARLAGTHLIRLAAQAVPCVHARERVDTLGIPAQLALIVAIEQRIH